MVEKKGESNPRRLGTVGWQVFKGKSKGELPSCRFPSRSSSREVRIRVPDFFPVVYFSRGALPQKRVKGHLAGGPSLKIRDRPLWVWIVRRTGWHQNSDENVQPLSPSNPQKHPWTQLAPDSGESNPLAK